MSILLGKQLPDGSIRYIKSDNDKSLSNIVSKLAFYPKEKQVDKLLALGDLEWLGKSPNNPNTRNSDTINCYAKKRDDGQRSKRLDARIADDLEEYLLFEELSFLFRDGEWFVHVNNQCENIKTVTSAILCEPKTMKEFTIEQIVGEKFERREFPNWQDMVQTANTENIPLFVFAGDYSSKRLLTTINPHLLKQK